MPGQPKMVTPQSLPPFCTICIFVAMRLLAIILTAYISTLAFAPAVQLLDLSTETECCATSCCTSAQQEKSADDCEDDCNGPCNPFLSCSTCVGFTLSQAISVTQPVAYTRAPESILQQFPLQQVAFAVWHPPQLG